MAQSVQSKKIMQMAYGLGAAIVIIGALFKITHMEIGPLNGNVMLTIGLVTEALIFAVSAFEPVDNDPDWSLVYPELAGENAPVNAESRDAEKLLSKKLDELLRNAKVDGTLMASLAEGIKNFEHAARGIAPTVDAVATTKKYNEALVLVTAHMESLNSLYKAQLENASRQAAINEETLEDASKLREQMQSLISNLSSLNDVYGGMLLAMNKKNQ